MKRNNPSEDEVKKLTAIIATALCAVSFSLPAAPAAAQSFSFGFGYNDSPRWHSRYDAPRWHRWDRPRRGITIDLGGVRVRTPVLRGHIARCEARFRSYDRWSDTYLGYDGKRHLCRL